MGSRHIFVCAVHSPLNPGAHHRHVFIQHPGVFGYLLQHILGVWLWLYGRSPFPLQKSHWNVVKLKSFYATDSPLFWHKTKRLRSFGWWLYMALARKGHFRGTPSLTRGQTHLLDPFGRFLHLRRCRLQHTSTANWVHCQLFRWFGPARPVTPWHGKHGY